ncbi:lipoprotein [Spiroplasma sp. hyd1]|uniref:lipoprotein n=1 Tax=Spiroplasma sp. hyd1 TaxID=1609976 RepID=UPI0018DC44CC|nr:lipoprotein [Spiroplasma sp. hyd1]MBH8623023.1 hypothetical protein [Spiroplasma sp. hyd1]
MKRILALLGAISLVGTSAVSVVACSHPQDQNVSVDDIKKQLEQYTDTPFFASSSEITNDKLASELASKITVGSYKLVVKADPTFVQPKISDGNALSAATINEFKTQLALTAAEGKLVVNNGSAIVSLEKKSTELFSVKIKWSTNELLFLASTINKINDVGDTTQNIKFPLPPIMPELDINLADLYSYLGLIELPAELINSIDLSQINTPDFVTKFNDVLKKISDRLSVLGLGDFLTKDLSFSFQVVKLTKENKTDITIKGTGTVNDLLHNIAPDVIALLQWYLKEGKERIGTTHNTVLPLIQYLLSPVNKNVQENIKTEFGETNWFYENTATNFDSLMFHLLSGYKGEPTKADNQYIFKVVGKVVVMNVILEVTIELDDVFDQSLVGNEGHSSYFGKTFVYLHLNPTLLIASILNVFSQNEGKGIDAVGKSILQPKTWKGINSLIQENIPAINVYLGPSIMNFAGPTILRNLGLSNTEINNNNITMTAGTVKLSLKNKNNQWEDFKATFKEGDKQPDLTQILNATDIKISFMNVKFKVTPKNNDKIAYETNGNINFDLWLSDLMN